MQEEGWVVCKVFKKKMTAVRKEGDQESLGWYDDQVSFMPDFDSPQQMPESSYPYQLANYPCKQELQFNMHPDTFLQLPNLESPKVLQHSAGNSSMPPSFPLQSLQESNVDSMINELQGVTDDQVTDWRVLDKFVASQLSQDGATNGEH